MPRHFFVVVIGSNLFEQNVASFPFLFSANATFCLQALYTDTIKRYDSTVGRISDLTKKTSEYRDASDKMEKNVESIPDVIAELE